MFVLFSVSVELWDLWIYLLEPKDKCIWHIATVWVYIFPVFPSSYLGGDFTVKVTSLHVNLRPCGGS